MKIYHAGASRLVQMGHMEELCSSQTIDEFISKVDKLSKDPKVGILFSEKDDPYGVKHYKGEVGEVFGEYLIAAFAMDPKFQVRDFVPTSSPASIIVDSGVDGYAQNVRGEYVSFQFKFKSNTQAFLSSDDHMGNFYSQSSTKLGIPYIEDNFQSRMIVVTTCQGVHPSYHENTFNNAFKVLNIQSIRNMVDGNEMFWCGLLDACKNS